MLNFISNFYNQFYEYFTSPELARALLPWKLVSWLVSIFFIILIAALVKKSEATWWIKESVNSRHSVYGAARLNKKWQKIMDRLQRGDQANLKLAVIESDGLLDEVLIRMALPGKDMSERLKQFERHELSSIDSVVEAHDLRNYIISSPAAHILLEQAEQAVGAFEKALRELEYL